MNFILLFDESHSFYWYYELKSENSIILWGKGSPALCGYCSVTLV